MHTPVTGFVREIMHEIILQSAAYLSRYKFLYRIIKHQKFIAIKIAANQILFVNINCNQKTTAGISSKRTGEKVRYYTKTRPRHVDKTSRTSMEYR
jgi:hypothetical protein